MKVFAFIRRVFAFAGKAFMVISTGLVGAVVLLLLLVWAAHEFGWGETGGDAAQASYDSGRQADTADLYAPVYKKYEQVSDFSTITEEAWEAKEYDGLPLEIYDPGLFEKVVVALEMMRREAPYEYNYVIDSTERIVQAKRTYASGRVTYLRPHDFASGVLWTSATLYHEATHHNQRPDMDRTDKELEAIGNEIELMRALDAPAQLIRAMEHQDGKHWDVDHDGRRTMADYFKQDW